MSFHRIVHSRRGTVVLHVLLFATGFAASALGLPRLERLNRAPARTSEPQPPTAVFPSAPSGSPGDPSPNPVPETPATRAPLLSAAPMKDLGAGLTRLRDILLDLAARETKDGQHCIIDGSEIVSLFDHRLNDARRTLEKLGPGTWKGLQAAVRADRQAYDLLVRNPENEKIARELLYLRGSDFRPDPFSVGEEVALETALLEGLLGSGTHLQRLAALDGYFNMTWHGDEGEPYRRSRLDASLPLLSDPDPEIRGAALRVLAARHPKALDLHVAEVRAAWPSSTEPQLQLDVLWYLSELPIRESPNVHSLVLEKIQGLVEGRDPAIRSQAIFTLYKMTSERDPDALNSYASMMATLFRSTRDREACCELLETSVRLPIVHLRRLLEEASASPLGPELRGGIDQVLHEINVGETRPKVFQKILENALGVHQRFFTGD